MNSAMLAQIGCCGNPPALRKPGFSTMTIAGKAMQSETQSPPIPDDEPDGRDVAAYVAALMASERLGHLVVHHRVLPATPAVFADPARPFSRTVAGSISSTPASDAKTMNPSVVMV